MGKIMEEIIRKKDNRMPVLVLRGRVMFPNISFSFDVGRKMSLYAVEKSMTSNTPLFVCTQLNSLDDEPTRFIKRASFAVW